MLAIVAPLAIELAAIRRSMPDAAARDIAFGVTGVGKEPARRYIRRIVKAAPEAVVLVGFCGGADPDLQPGDLHIAQSFLSPDFSDSIDCDPQLNDLLACTGQQIGARVVSGTSVTVGNIASPGSKSRLHAATGSASVNMEDYWLAQVARDAGVPFASVRAVLDSAHAKLPDYLSKHPSNAAHVLGSLLLHPGRTPAVLRLACWARAARASLTLCVLAAVEILAPQPSVLSTVSK